MIIGGKIIGCLLGSFFGIIGAAIGLLIGHFFDYGLKKSLYRYPHNKSIKLAFFKASFATLGAMAKADGNVARQEIQYVESLISQLQLNASQRKIAIELFNNGKHPNFNLEPVLTDFVKAAHTNSDLLQFFLEIQISIAMANGSLHQRERELLSFICAKLNLTQETLELLIKMHLAGQNFHNQPQSTDNLLSQAYQTLGITSSTSDAQLKKCYRKLISQHHPDKLSAKGAPPEMLQFAKEKSQEITTAYTTIAKARGIK